MFCFIFFHARLFLAECPLQAMGTEPPALSSFYRTVGPFLEGPLVIHYPSNLYRKVIAIIYVDEETRVNRTVFLGLYFMSFFIFFSFFFSLPYPSRGNV